MKREKAKVTTIELDEQDNQRIVAIQEHIVRAEKPIYNVSKRIAISWALRKAAESLRGEENGSCA